MNKVYKLKRSSHGVKVVSEIAKGHSGEKTVREGFGSTIFSSIGKIASAPALGRLAMSLATIVAISAPFMPSEAEAGLVCKNTTTNALYYETGNSCPAGSEVVTTGVSLGNSVATGDYSVAFGLDSHANAYNSLALMGGTANKNHTYAIGVNALANADNTIAFGNHSGALGASGVAMGNTAIAKSDNSVAIGTNASAGLDKTRLVAQSSRINNGDHFQLETKAYRPDEMAAMGLGSATKQYHYVGYQSGNQFIKIGGLATDESLYAYYQLEDDGVTLKTDANGNWILATNATPDDKKKKMQRPDVFRVYKYRPNEDYDKGNNFYDEDGDLVNLRRYWVGDDTEEVTSNIDKFIDNNKKDIRVIASDGKDKQIAIGQNSLAVKTAAVAIGNNANAIGDDTIAIGRNVQAAVIKNGNAGNIAIGSYAKAVEKNVYDPEDRPGQSIAIGYKSEATGGQAMAIGANAIASGYGSISIGGDDIGNVASAFKAKAIKEYMDAIGDMSAVSRRTKMLYQAFGGGNMNEPWVGSVGYIATKADGLGSLAVGQSSIASNTFSSAFGFTNTASGVASTAIGLTNIADGAISTAIGAENKVYDTNSTAIGVSNYVDNKSSNSMSLGNGNKISDSDFSIAAGYYNENHADNTITVGLYNDANKTNAAAVGLNNYALGKGSIAVGGENNATGAYSTAFGLRNQADKDNTLAIGTLNNAEAENSMALGADNNTTKRYSVAAGMSNLAEGEKSAALGFGNTASADRSFSVGMDNNVTETGVESIAHGYGNIVKGKNSIAMGTGNTVTGNRSGVFGDPSVINSNDSYSVGNNNNIAAGNNSVFILGNNVTNTFANSVFLGDSAAYETGNTTGGMSAVNSANVGGVTYSGFAGNTPVGVVSIGKEGSARRIQNVAAGLISKDSTDAINGSQLYAVLPTYTTADVNGNVSNVKIGDKTYNFQNLKAGTNITIQDDGTINAENPNPTTTLKSDNRVVRISTDEIQSPLLHINGVADADKESAKANGVNAIAMGKDAFTSEGLDTDEAKTKAYDTYATTIKKNGNLKNDQRIKDADNYDSMIGALTEIIDENKDFGTNATKEKIYKAATTQINNLISQYKLTNAPSDNAIAIGTSSMASSNSSIAMGENAWALTPYAVTIGSGSRGSQGLGGRTAGALDTPDAGGYSITIGHKASTFLTNVKAPGTSYYANTKNSTAIGTAAHTHAANALAIGFSTDATGERSFALGTGSTSLPTGQNHSGSRAGGQGSIVIGDQATAFRYAKEEFVGGDFERSEAGADINVNDAVAIGTGSFVKSQNSVALGGGISYTYHLRNDDNTSVKIETKYYADDDKKWQKDAEGIGAEVGIGATGAVAIGGASADISGADNTYYPTFDENNLTIANYTSAAKVAQNAAKAVAIGSGSNANVKNGVALGSYSLANRDNESNVATKIFKGYDMQTNTKGAANTATPDDPTWIATHNAIAVGAVGDDIDKNITRQITGLAAGSEDTDAVNVAQLKRAVGGTVWSVGIDKDGTGTNKDGTLTFGTHTVGTKDYNKTGLDFIAGDNVDISYVELSTDNNKTDSAYGIKFSAKDTNVTSKNGSVIITSEYNADTMTTGYDLKVPVKLTDNNGTIKLVSYGIDGDENSSRPVKITNLAPGEADTDAVNVSQLKEAAEGNRTYLTV
ncbi:hypothetical protein OFO07_07205, partial [Campylobacter sp. JMF_06 NA1]|uniref:hypothetical protein n=1 Tax=Campylobacter sp. JMF_06 NA1 TaxID=2983823 RepID=UPI0022E9FE25